MSYIGTSKVGGMYLGDTKISKAYLGDNLVYRVYNRALTADEILHNHAIDISKYNITTT